MGSAGSQPPRPAVTDDEAALLAKFCPSRTDPSCAVVPEAALQRCFPRASRCIAAHCLARLPALSGNSECTVRVLAQAVDSCRTQRKAFLRTAIVGSLWRKMCEEPSRWQAATHSFVAAFVTLSYTQDLWAIRAPVLDTLQPVTNRSGPDWDFGPLEAALSQALSRTLACLSNEWCALEAATADWVEGTLPRLTNLLTDSFGSQLLAPPTAGKRDSLRTAASALHSGAPNRPLSESEAEREASGGWRGTFCASDATRCLTELSAWALRQSTSEFGPWARLFASWNDGCSFATLCAKLIGYPGRTVLLLATDAGEILGAAYSGVWSGSARFDTSATETFLFRSAPRFEIFRAGVAGKYSANHAWLNGGAVSGAPKGIGFGGQAGVHRLWINDDLRSGYTCSTDGVFASEAGAEDPQQRPLQIEALEVWGTADARAEEDFKDEQRRRAEAKAKRRVVDRSKLANSEFDRDMFFDGKFGGGDGRQ